MDLSQDQYDLIKAVSEVNPRTVVVNFSGAPVTMAQFIDTNPAVLQAWFPGQECGHSVAAVLSGNTNPCGRLPMSWPCKGEDNPSWGNLPVGDDLLLHYKEGLNVGYRYYDRQENPDPLFEFGYGLSYTSFEISNFAFRGPFTISSVGSRLPLECNVNNTSKRAGKVVVQCYVKFPETVFGQQRPVKELKAFPKVDLKARQCRRITLELDKYAVSAYDSERACWRAEAGRYEIEIGFSVKDIVARTTMVVDQAFEWTGV